MRTSLGDIWWKLDEKTDIDEDESKAIDIVRTGLTFAKPGCRGFWDNFKDICNQAPALSKLLDVDETTIGGWADRIDQIIQKITTSDSDSIHEKPSEMISTGNQPINVSPQDTPGTRADTRND